MVPFIIFVIYIFFLRELELASINSEIMSYLSASNYNGTDANLNRYINTLVDSWMLSGITALSTITVSLQTNNIIVSDKENGINRDFASSPLSSSILIMSYFVSNFIITVTVCFVFLLVCLIYLACLGEFILTITNFLVIIGVLLYTTINSVLFTVFICSFITKDSTMSSVIAIFSTAIGFLIGAYMPLANLPQVVQNLCAFIPGTYVCALFRYSFMVNPMTEMTNYVVNVLQITNGTELMSDVINKFGYGIQAFGVNIPTQYQSLILFGFTVLFLILNIVFGNKLISVLGEVGKKFKKKK
jgi:multidrug/hemolysin transport system permease protein